MPPSKKAQQKAQQKAMEKRAERIVEDKTFGLKNKNKSMCIPPTPLSPPPLSFRLLTLGKKVQQYVQNIKKVYTGKVLFRYFSI